MKSLLFFFFFVEIISPFSKFLPFVVEKKPNYMEFLKNKIVNLVAQSQGCNFTEGANISQRHKRGLRNFFFPRNPTSRFRIVFWHRDTCSHQKAPTPRSQYFKPQIPLPHFPPIKNLHFRSNGANPRTIHSHGSLSNLTATNLLLFLIDLDSISIVI